MKTNKVEARLDILFFFVVHITSVISSLNGQMQKSMFYVLVGRCVCLSFVKQCFFFWL